MRMVFWSGAAFYNSVPNLFAEIRKNICEKTCAYFPKYSHVFAEIRLRFCGNKFEIDKNAGFGEASMNSASVANNAGGRHPLARC